VLAKVEQVAPTFSTVLLRGETGTGKELVAHAIHINSPREEKPFVRVNCAALAPGILESELFGHEKGSFTGAMERRRGRFELADGGTLFLDEVGDLPMEVQIKLLRTLQERELERVGGNETIKVDVRVVSATNRNLEKMIEEGDFREDLYYRLNVFPINLPPLRDRGADVELLGQAFLDELNSRYNTKKTFPPSVRDMLASYPWPGNVRELKNYVQRAYIMSGAESDSTATVPLQISLAKPSAGTAVTIPFGTSLAEADRQLILATLEQCGGVKTRAAEILGISLKTLYNRLVEYGEDAANKAAENEASEVGDGGTGSR
jgi:transcriptional regulator with GAF, ATPase, and Fis domain